MISWFAILIVSNEEIEDIMKIVKSLEDSGLIIKCVSEVIKNEGKEQNGGFASLLGNLLTGKSTIRAPEGTITADKNF